VQGPQHWIKNESVKVEGKLVLFVENFPWEKHSQNFVLNNENFPRKKHSINVVLNPESNPWEI
jgi:hypothetical protein